MTKTTYQRPAMCIIALQHQHHLLSESSGSQSSSRPTATYMSNPDIDNQTREVRTNPVNWEE